jgi:hypothetical protein
MSVVSPSAERSAARQPDPDARIAVLLAGSAIGAIAGLAILGVAVSGATGLIYAAVAAIGSVTGAAIAVLRTAIRWR